VTGVGKWSQPVVTVLRDATFSTLTQTETLPRLHCSGPKN
jgi:hypothetical protein